MDSNVILAFGLTLFAGLSTGIGSALAFFTRRTNTSFLSTALGFSAGVMVYVSFVEILVKARESLAEQFGDTRAYWYATIAFFAGLVVGMITELPGFWDFFTYTFEADWMIDIPMTSFKYMWVYLAYFVIMVVRPRGLFGWKH